MCVGGIFTGQIFILDSADVKYLYYQTFQMRLAKMSIFSNDLAHQDSTYLILLKFIHSTKNTPRGSPKKRSYWDGSLRTHIPCFC